MADEDEDTPDRDSDQGDEATTIDDETGSESEETEYDSESEPDSSGSSIPSGIGAYQEIFRSPAIVEAVQRQQKMKELFNRSAVTQELRNIRRTERMLEETLQRSGIAEAMRSAQETNERLVRRVNAVSASLDQYQSTVATIQSALQAQRAATALAQAATDLPSHRIAALLSEFRAELREAVEHQIELEEPWDYESRAPDSRAQTTALNWGKEFTEALADVDHPDLDRMTQYVSDGLDAFEEEPDRPYAAIHIFISAQDALLSWLCLQSEGLEPTKENEAGLPVYGTEEKEKALRDHYIEYLGIGSENDIAGEWWLPYWKHRHEIVHGGPFATYDMNIATAALLQYALTANTVIALLEDYHNRDEVPPSAFEKYLQAVEKAEQHDSSGNKSGSIFGDFMADESEDNTNSEDSTDNH